MNRHQDEPGTEIVPLRTEQQVEVVDYGAIAALSRAEIDVQVNTAKAYPRSPDRFMKLAEQLACMNEEMAEQCFYKLPRDGKMIEGPSVRLAELAAYAWGNLRVEARLLGEDDRFVTAQASAIDLERNVGVRVEKKRRITNKQGRKFSDDMVATTANAAASIAYRDAVLRVIPRAFITPIYEKAKQVAIGNAETLAARRDKAIAYLTQKLGVSLERVLPVLGEHLTGVADIGLAELETLKGMCNAIKQGEATIDEVFPALQPSTKKTEAVADKLKQQAEAAAATRTAGSTQAPAAAEQSVEQPTNADDAVKKLATEIEDGMVKAGSLKALDAAYRDVTRNADRLGDRKGLLDKFYLQRKSEITGKQAGAK